MPFFAKSVLKSCATGLPSTGSAAPERKRSAISVAIKSRFPPVVVRLLLFCTAASTVLAITLTEAAPPSAPEAEKPGFELSRSPLVVL